MKLTKNSFLLLLTIKAENLSCVEKGGWRGVKAKPDPDNSDYPINEENDCYDIQRASLERQTSVCESLRQKNNGDGWSLRDNGPARLCTVYNEILSEHDNNYTIRGVACSVKVTRNISAAIGSFSQTLSPSFLSSRSPFKTIISSQTPTKTPTLNFTLVPTISPTKAHSKKSFYYYESIVAAVLSAFLLLSCCLCYIRKRIVVHGSVKETIISFAWKPNLLIPPGDHRQISGESSNTTLSRYLNPFSKKSTVRSEQESFLLNLEVSK